MKAAAIDAIGGDDPRSGPGSVSVPVFCVSSSAKGVLIINVGGGCRSLRRCLLELVIGVCCRSLKLVIGIGCQRNWLSELVARRLSKLGVGRTKVIEARSWSLELSSEVVVGARISSSELSSEVVVGAWSWLSKLSSEVVVGA
ncbi:uncharacterized protein LOC120092963 [Benincasa hispida]|uniref:uncharacterized protein LOC120092963 n=1 Tax=Benincasa hispida TaxID=102211 RepID=UPI0019023C71|nr:uncharacterized protein LOC120092963 [Benincasa hispida]